MQNTHFTVSMVKKKKKKSGNLKICFYVVASKLSVFKSKYYFK